jgi:hypothetical protein
MSTTPVNEQYMEALERANEIRVHRAQLKRDLKAGKVAASELIDRPYPMVDTMKVIDVLVAMPKTGRIKANARLKRCNVSPSKTLGDLSERQRNELVRGLPACVQRQAA